MSQIRLYIDEDSGNLSLVESLRNSAVEVMTTSDANKLSSSDEEQLIWATEQGRVIYSSNMGDFCRLHRTFAEQKRTHSGIIRPLAKVLFINLLDGLFGPSHKKK